MHFFFFFLFIMISDFGAFAFSSEPNYVEFDDVFIPSVSLDAIPRNEVGFEKDFFLLHSLIRQYKPTNLFEIGTCMGNGTMIAKNAIGIGTIYSLDLPPGEGPYSLSLEMIGQNCSLPFIQVFGDSMSYDYSKHFPIEAWFIDGWHDYDHVYYETLQSLLSDPKLIIWHDTDIPEVFEAVLDALKGVDLYDLYRVTDTRISYAVKR